MILLAAEVRRRPSVHHALVGDQVCDVPAGACRDGRADSRACGRIAESRTAGHQRLDVVIETQMRRHGGIIESALLDVSKLS